MKTLQHFAMRAGMLHIPQLKPQPVAFHQGTALLPEAALVLDNLVYKSTEPHVHACHKLHSTRVGEDYRLLKRFGTRSTGTLVVHWSLIVEKTDL